MRLALSLTTALVLWPGTSTAEISSFRLVGLEPAKNGATLKISFKNEWGDPQRNKDNAEVELFGHTKKPSTANAMHSEDRSMPLGTVKMLGTGMIDVPIDYAKCKVKAGQSFCVSGAWLKSDHRHGESWTGVGRSAGILTLPEPLKAAKRANKAKKANKAKQNSSLRPFHLRWRAGRGPTNRSWTPRPGRRPTRRGALRRR